MVKKKKQNSRFDVSNFGVLGIVALVAIVAVVALLGSGPSASSQGLSLDDSNLVGDARYDIGRDSYEIRGERYVREDRREPVREVDMSIFVDERELLAGLDEDELDVPSVDDIPVPSSAGAYALSFGSAKSGSGCNPLTQSMLPGNGTNISINISGCVELSGDIDFGTGALFLLGSSELQCNGHEILGTGDYGLVLEDSSVARDCVVKNRDEAGFHLSDTSQVFDSVSKNNNRDGFRLYVSSSVSDSVAVNNNWDGFRLYGSSSVTGSVADGNEYGFLLYGLSSSVSDSVAENNNWAGFYLWSSFSSVSDSVAENNWDGFRLLHSSSVTGSVAEDNYHNGFDLYHSSSVVDSEAVNNYRHGFLLRDSSSVTDGVARNNGDDGFVLWDSSSIIGSNEATGNSGNGVFVPVGKSLSGLAGRFCNNGNQDVLANCEIQGGNLVCGSISGTFRADNYAVGNGNAQVSSCSKLLDDDVPRLDNGHQREVLGRR